MGKSKEMFEQLRQNDIREMIEWRDYYNFASHKYYGRKTEDKKEMKK